MTSELVSLVCSPMKLERDRGVSEINRHLLGCNATERSQLAKELVRLDFGSWENRHGCMLGAKALVHYVDVEDEFNTEFLERIKGIAKQFLTDLEDRVRIAAGQMLGALCEKLGPSVYVENKEYILHLIRTNLFRQLVDDNSSKLEQLETEKLLEKISGNISEFQDSAGWRNLETSLKCLQAVIDGCGVGFQPFIDQDLLDLIYETITHTNWFIRESGFYLFASLVNKEQDLEDLARHLASGLSDDCSQVRLAACVATRRFLLDGTSDAKENFYPLLLPPMCLNRYYSADGVRIYSQETWRQVTLDQGTQLVEKHISTVIDYYTSMCRSENHGVREAACSCIAELATKLNPNVLQAYASSLLNSLLGCLGDPVWSVRDASCLACGTFLINFPDECHPSMSSLYPAFFRNLQDPIASVRQGAAFSLANAVKAWKQDALLVVMEQITTGLSEPWDLADGCVYLLTELSGTIDVCPALLLVAKVCRSRHYHNHDLFMNTVCKQLPLIGKNMDRRMFKTVIEEFFDAIFFALENGDCGTSSSASQCLNQISSLIGPNILRAKVANYQPNYLHHLDANAFLAPF